MPLPVGPAVTFLFTDIEGSTRLERAVGTADWSAVVARHDALLREAIESNGGVVVKTEGDAFFAAFARPSDATRAAVAAQRAIAAETWPDTCRLKVRMGLHTGEGRLRAGRAAGEPEDYVGIDVNYAARIAATGNGGQIVMSNALVERLGSDPLPEGKGVRRADEGLRAVKDFEEPQRLHRLVVPDAADDTRPLRTLDPPTNLPGEVTELVGRAAEIEALRNVLEATRILTLTGPGGSGKTRLALGLAHSMRDRFAHGTWFVDLSAVQEASIVEPAIASTLGLRDTAEQAMAEVLRAHLRDRSMLLVLDNLEQLLPAAAGTVASIARAAPEVRFVITSREILRIGGEHGYAVPPLDLDAGMALFEARARAIRPDLDLSAVDRIALRKIVERVSGLPLAIELAAARIRLMSPTVLLDRLASSLDLAGGARDLPERQRTLRGAMAWSHDLLSDPERTLFRRLGIFAGGFTAEVAIQIGDPEGTLGIDTFGGLESLADKSLLRIEAAGSDAADATAEPRFDLHPLLREYALERLDESGERPEVERAHAEAMAAIAQSFGERVQGAAGATAVRRLDAEQHNLRAALDWALRTGDVATGIRIVSSTWRWYQQRGRLREARAVLARLLAEPDLEPRLRIAALAAEGGLAYWADDVDAARAAYEERLDLAEATGDPLLRADAHYDYGYLFMLAHDPGRLLEHEQRAVELYTEVGQVQGALRARQALGVALFLTGEYRRALQVDDENLDELRAAGLEFQVADSFTFHAAIHFMLGEPAAAWDQVLDSLRWFGDNDNATGIARAMAMAAIIMLTEGEAEFGARIAGATYQLAREKGVMLAPVRVLHLPEPADLATERLGEERARAALAEAADLPLRDVIDEILAAPAPSAEGAVATTDG